MRHPVDSTLIPSNTVTVGEPVVHLRYFVRREVNVTNMNTNYKISRKGTSMKRATLIAVLALTILFAMTASAFAEVNTLTGNFQAWDSGHAGNGNGTPHVSYSTTSEKCAVCHSVHNADYANPAGGQNILLRSDKADACTYCHMDASITSNRPYAETATNYTTDTVFNHSNSSAVLTSYSGCPSCHSVHGAGTFDDASVATSILKDWSGADADAPAGSDRASFLTEFCSQCHAYYPSDYDVLADGEGNHIMTATFNDYDNPEASASATGSPVANAGSADCTSCHDAVGTGNGDSFPHYMPNNARFLVAADYQGAGSTTATVSEASVDGACIKCHLWNGATEGVGEDF